MSLIIAAKQSRIISINLPDLKSMSNNCLFRTENLTLFKANNLKSMGNNCLFHAPVREEIIARMKK